MALSNLPIHLSFSRTPPNPLFLFFSNLSLTPPKRTPTLIRMRGGPTSYPGGVSKRESKRIQARKAKKLHKVGLSRERQIYEMRKRAELKAAVSELERPWEPVQKAAPDLFSVSADEQVKVLADRFQKLDDFDLSTHRDRPQLFEIPDGIPSARFFPEGVLQSVEPNGEFYSSGFEDPDSVSGLDSEGEKQGNGLRVDSGNVGLKRNGGEWRKKKRGRRRTGSRLNGKDAGKIGKGMLRRNGDKRNGRSDNGNGVGRNGGGFRHSRDF